MIPLILFALLVLMMWATVESIFNPHDLPTKQSNGDRWRYHQRPHHRP